MKKIVAIITLCLTCVCFTVGFAACDNGDVDKGNNTDNYPQSIEDKYFAFTLLDNDTYEISAKNVNDMPTNIALPKNHDGKAVTSIGVGAFSNCNSLASITIPNSVTNIGNGAFSGCSSLRNITIPNVTSIGYATFYGCIGLTSVIIGDNVTIIGERAFAYCSGLTNITIPNNITSIGVQAFYGCSGLTTIIIPKNVTSIGMQAFYGCSGLVSVIFDYTYSWVVSTDSAFSSCMAISSSNLTNTSTATTYLRSTYLDYFWKRS